MYLEETLHWLGIKCGVCQKAMQSFLIFVKLKHKTPKLTTLIITCHLITN